MEISWEYHGNIIETSWKPHENFMETSWKPHWNSRKSHGNLLLVSWHFLRAFWTLSRPIETSLTLLISIASQSCNFMLVYWVIISCILIMSIITATNHTLAIHLFPTYYTWSKKYIVTTTGGRNIKGSRICSVGRCSSLRRTWQQEVWQDRSTNFISSKYHK